MCIQAGPLGDGIYTFGPEQNKRYYVGITGARPSAKQSVSSLFIVEAEWRIYASVN